MSSPGSMAIRSVEVAPPDIIAVSETEEALVKRLRGGRAALPMLPHVATVALSLAGDADASVSKLADLVDADPPIAARFLSVANSAAYWRGYTAASTQAAIVRLGLAATRDLLFQIVYAASTRGLKRYQRLVQASFLRSVRCGVVARAICREMRWPYEFAYMSGLLHDIGEARVYRTIASLPKPREGLSHVRDLVARHHADAGAEIAMAWRLPADIVDVCAAHHSLEAAGSPHVRLVMLADAVVDLIEHERTRRWEPPDYSRFMQLGVDEREAKLLVEHARAELAPADGAAGSSRGSGRPSIPQTLRSDRAAGASITPGVPRE